MKRSMLIAAVVVCLVAAPFVTRPVQADEGPGPAPCIITPVGALCLDRPPVECSGILPCELPPHPHATELASCEAVDVHVSGPLASEVSLSASSSRALPAGPDHAHGDAAQASATVGSPFPVGVGVVESRCDSDFQHGDDPAAFGYFDDPIAASHDPLFGFFVPGTPPVERSSHWSCGEADVADLQIDMSSVGGPVVDADVLVQQGCSFGGNGFNSANVAGLEVSIGNVALAPIDLAAPPNTTLFLPGGATLILNEQGVVFHEKCVEHYGSALRLVVPGAADVVVSHVSTCA